MFSIVAFRVFSVHLPEPTEYLPVDWMEAHDVVSLNEAFFAQINNRLLMKEEAFTLLDESIRDGYKEAIDRDDWSLYEELEGDLQPYAAVLLRDGEYYGHIYSWKEYGVPAYSPSGKQPIPICFAVGIRSRVDMQSLRGTDAYVPGIARYLLEGIRLLALQRGCIRVGIPSPLRPMEIVLDRLGFKNTRIFGTVDEGSIFHTSTAYMNSNRPVEGDFVMMESLVNVPIDFSVYH